MPRRSSEAPPPPFSAVASKDAPPALPARGNAAAQQPKPRRISAPPALPDRGRTIAPVLPQRNAPPALPDRGISHAQHRTSAPPPSLVDSGNGTHSTEPDPQHTAPPKQQAKRGNNSRASTHYTEPTTQQELQNKSTPPPPYTAPPTQPVHGKSAGAPPPYTAPPTQQPERGNNKHGGTKKRRGIPGVADKKQVVVNQPLGAEGGETKKSEEDSAERRKKDDEDKVDKMEKRRDQVQYVEYAVNAADYAKTGQDIASNVELGAEVVEESTAMTQLAADAGDIDINEAFAAVQDVGDQTANTAAGGEAIATLTDATRQAATDNIVEGHKYHDCIEDTCLEEPVRFVAEECAVPCYEFLGRTCGRLMCSGSAEENLDNTREATGHARDAADGAEEGFGCCNNFFETMCAVFDLECCVLDEALGFALPIFGLVFSFLRCD